MQYTKMFNECEKQGYNRDKLVNFLYKYMNNKERNAMFKALNKHRLKK